MKKLDKELAEEDSEDNLLYVFKYFIETNVVIMLVPACYLCCEKKSENLVSLNAMK